MSIVFEHAILGSGAPPSAYDSHVSSVDKLAPFRLKHVGGGKLSCNDEACSREPEITNPGPKCKKGRVYMDEL